jgi:hypothetical protein
MTLRLESGTVTAREGKGERRITVSSMRGGDPDTVQLDIKNGKGNWVAFIRLSTAEARHLAGFLVAEAARVQKESA